MAQTERIRRYSQQLRKNMTKEERHLWYDYLKSYPLPFHRQYSIGNYIVDFYCHKAKLVLELDGSQHCTLEAIEYDRKRTEFLEKQGLCVLRISNLDVMRQFRAVCEMIDERVQRQLVR
ncbi:MAG: endonuclease domain-containing protein [Oscillospiraceae bacterium]|nr:endonuclease domain-containing protein [Oscillospiraceae bacterium]